MAAAGGRIRYAGTADGWQAETQRLANAGEMVMLDLAGQYLLPGLIDLHVHLAMGSVTPWRRPARRAPSAGTAG